MSEMKVDLGDVDGMRARELRNLLIQKLGYSVESLSKIIDRAELKELVLDALSIGYRQRQQEYQQKIFIVTTVLAAVVVVVVLFQKQIIKITRKFLRWIAKKLQYQTAQKVKMISFGLKHKLWFAVVLLFLSIGLDSYLQLMQISILLSWFVPTGSFLRDYLIRSPVSFALTPSMLSIPTNSYATNFGLDVGPIVTMMAGRWVVTKLDELAASYLIVEVNDKESKKTEKEAIHKFFG